MNSGWLQICAASGRPRMSEQPKKCGRGQAGRGGSGQPGGRAYKPQEPTHQTPPSQWGRRCGQGPAHPGSHLQPLLYYPHTYGGHSGGSLYAGVRGKGTDYSEYFSIAKKVLATITMEKDAYVRDVSGAILQATLIRRVADGVLSTIGLKQQLIPSLLRGIMT
eukprot:327185-Prymnesium_polylepis.1